MNTKALKTTMDWKTTGIIKGVQVKQIPHEGCAAYYYIGSDTYGFMVKNISDDGMTFDLVDKNGNDRGKAILVTRKNSKDCGFYARMQPNGKPSKVGGLAVTDQPGCGQTRLDPSF